MCCMRSRISKVLIERISTAVLSKGIFFFIYVDFSLKVPHSANRVFVQILRQCAAKQKGYSDTGMELVASGLEKVTTLTKFRA